jgi:hypothetical protein
MEIGGRGEHVLLYNSSKTFKSARNVYSCSARGKDHQRIVSLRDIFAQLLTDDLLKKLVPISLGRKTKTSCTYIGNIGAHWFFAWLLCTVEKIPALWVRVCVNKEHHTTKSTTAKASLPKDSDRGGQEGPTLPKRRQVSPYFVGGD